MESWHEQREILRGSEEQIFDLVGSGASLRPRVLLLWGQWLQAPLEHAAAAGDSNIATKLLAAGANGKHAAVQSAFRGGHRRLAAELFQQGTSQLPEEEETSEEYPTAEFAEQLQHRYDDQRAVLRGSEKLVFDLVRSKTTSLEWTEWLNAPVEHAAARADVDLTLKLLSAGANSMDAMFSATQCHHDNLVDVLLRRNASLAAGYTDARPSIHLAACLGHTKIVCARLHDDGVDKNGWDSIGDAPLHVAARHGKLDVVKVLLTAGANINRSRFIQRGDGTDSDHIYVTGPRRRKSPSTTRYGKHADGRSPLHMAAAGGHFETLKFLVQSGARVRMIGGLHRTTVLHEAARARDNRAALDFLVRSGVGVNAQDIAGVTPLHLAAAGGHAENIRALLRLGAGVHCAGGLGQTTALHEAVRADTSNRAALCTLEDKAIVNARDQDRDTPLRFSCAGTRFDAALALLLHGARVDTKDAKGNTPLHISVSRGCGPGVVEVVELLLMWGADESTVNRKGRTALQSLPRFRDTRGGAMNRLVTLLTDSPADRLWHRRGLWVLSRAYPDRLRVPQVQSSESAVDTVVDSNQPPSRRSRLATSTGTDEGRGVPGGAPDKITAAGDWGGLVRRVVGLKVKAGFQTIVGFL